jgi:hypothetical protein
VHRVAGRSNPITIGNFFNDLLALVITEGPDQYQLAEYFFQREIWVTVLRPI